MFFYTPGTVRLGDLECFPGSNLHIFCLVFDLLKFFVNYEKKSAEQNCLGHGFGLFYAF